MLDNEIKKKVEQNINTKHLCSKYARECHILAVPYNGMKRFLCIYGGFVFVYRGLLEMVKTESELAAVLSHEVGHIVGRHSANNLMLDFRARQVFAAAQGREAAAVRDDYSLSAIQLALLDLDRSRARAVPAEDAS